MMNDFYARAFALRDKYQAEYQSGIKISILSQIVAAVFANDDIFPKSIYLEYDYESNLLDAREINLTFHKLSIEILDDLSIKPFASLPGYYSRKNVLTVQCLFS